MQSEDFGVKKVKRKLWNEVDARFMKIMKLKKEKTSNFSSSDWFQIQRQTLPKVFPYSKRTG